MKPQVPSPEDLPHYTKIKGFTFDGSIQISNLALESREQSVAAIEDGYLMYRDVLQEGFPEYNDAITAMYSLSVLLNDGKEEQGRLVSMDDYDEVGVIIYNLKQFIKFLPLLQGLADETDEQVILDDNLSAILSKLLEVGIDGLKTRIETILIRIRTYVTLDIDNTIGRLREMTYPVTTVDSEA